MSLTYENRIIAEVKPGQSPIQGTSGIGGYILKLPVEFVMLPWEIDTPNHISLVTLIENLRAELFLQDRFIGEAVAHKTVIGPTYSIGRALPKSEFIWFSIVLNPMTLEKVEQIRAGGKLNLVLRVNGVGRLYAIQNPESPSNSAFALPGSCPPVDIGPSLYPPMHVESNALFLIPQSTWVEIIQAMGYGRSMLYEIPWAQLDGGQLPKATVAWENAQKAFFREEYVHSVGECRKCWEALKQTLGHTSDVWAKAKLGKDQVASISDRFQLVWESVKHLTSFTHHIIEDGRLDQETYSREQARYILGMTALCLSLAGKSPGSLGTPPPLRKKPKSGQP